MWGMQCKSVRYFMWKPISQLKFICKHKITQLKAKENRTFLNEQIPVSCSKEVKFVATELCQNDQC